MRNKNFNKDIAVQRSEELKKNQRIFYRLSIFISILFPVLTVLLINGAEQITVYLSTLNESVAGVITAQVLSVISDILRYALMLGGIILSGAAAVKLGEKRSLPVFFASLLNPVITRLTLIVTMYFLVIAGLSEYTLGLFFSSLGSLVFASMIPSVIDMLVVIVGYIIFYFHISDGDIPLFMDRAFMNRVYLFFAGVCILQIVSFAFDISAKDIYIDGFSDLVSYIIYPLGCVLLSLLGGFIAIKAVIAVCDKRLKGREEQSQ